MHHSDDEEPSGKKAKAGGEEAEPEEPRIKDELTAEERLERAKQLATTKVDGPRILRMTAADD